MHLLPLSPGLNAHTYLFPVLLLRALNSRYKCSLKHFVYVHINSMLPYYVARINVSMYFINDALSFPVACALFFLLSIVQLYHVLLSLSYLILPPLFCAVNKWCDCCWPKFNNLIAEDTGTFGKRKNEASCEPSPCRGSTPRSASS